ncbi:MAG: hypothetical protein CMH52_11950 [Myxococcales bacterium]|nr:hypothetical protein [Myxococcales bacterium]|tara:strand:- start:743 stop:1972 length:1230 start_codon:yes stop_codon:yes gene_type:complete
MRSFNSNLSRWILITTTLNYVACAGQLEPIQTHGPQVKQHHDGDNLSEVYPQSPDSHYTASNQNQRGTPDVLNAVAYARYAAELNGETRIGFETDVASIAMSMAEQADASGLPLKSMIRYKTVGASESDYRSFAEEVERDARSVQQPGTLSRELKALLDGALKLELCIAENNDVIGCCQALSWVEALGKNIETGDESFSAATRRLIDEQAQAVADGHRTQLQPFNQSGIKAWLAYCGAEVTNAPSHLADFKAEYGDYSVAPEWTKEFHPISPAKQAGRRISRRHLPDGTFISVAESTDENCQTRETEVILARPGQQSIFWVFDRIGHRVSYAYFPTRRPNEDAVRVAPNACMGCHYTMDSRRFSVPTPSFEALNLKLFESADGPVWRDDSICVRRGEQVIYHAVDVIGR